MAAKQPTSIKRRWHEQSYYVADAINTWMHYPPLLQQILAKRVLKLIKVEQLTKQPVHLFNFFPRVYIQCMFLKRKRWYDKHPDIRNAMNLIRLLSLRDMEYVAEHIINLRIHLSNLGKPVIDYSEAELIEHVSYAFNHPNMIVFGH